MSCTLFVRPNASPCGSSVIPWDNTGHFSEPGLTQVTHYTVKLLPHLLFYLNSSIFSSKQSTHDNCKKNKKKMLMLWSWHMSIMAFSCTVLSLVLPHWFHRWSHCMALLNMLTHRISFFSSYCLSHGKSKWKHFLYTPPLNCWKWEQVHFNCFAAWMLQFVFPHFKAFKTVSSQCGSGFSATLAFV